MKGRFAGATFDAVTGEVRGMTFEEFEAKMKARGMTVDGREIPDPKPFKPNVKIGRQPSMFDIHRMRMAQEAELRRQAEPETEEDMLDFGPEGDEDIIERLSEYERADLDLVLAQIEARRKSSESERLPDTPSGGEGSAGSGDSPADSGTPAA